MMHPIQIVTDFNREKRKYFFNSSINPRMLFTYSFYEGKSRKVSWINAFIFDLYFIQYSPVKLGIRKGKNLH